MRHNMQINSAKIYRQLVKIFVLNDMVWVSKYHDRCHNYYNDTAMNLLFCANQDE